MYEQIRRLSWVGKRVKLDLIPVLELLLREFFGGSRWKKMQDLKFYREKWVVFKFFFKNHNWFDNKQLPTLILGVMFLNWAHATISKTICHWEPSCHRASEISRNVLNRNKLLVIFLTSASVFSSSDRFSNSCIVQQHYPRHRPKPLSPLALDLMISRLNALMQNCRMTCFD